VILAIVGDFATAEMERRLAAKLAGWPTKPSPAVTLPPPQDARGRRLLLVDKPDSTQTFYRIGNVGIARTDTDRVHVAVVNTLFGGRFTSMLNTELRVNSGLTYGARSVFELRKQPGPFAIASFTANETTERALDMTLDILKRLHENGVSESELQSAKKYIKGQFPPTIETSSQLATLLSSLEFYGLDENEVNGMYARIDSMTVADARRVIKEHFPLENLVFVLIGKAGDIEKVAKKYAPQIETKSITEPGF
jgi:predicted Zn-dependent peptidase